MMSWDYWINRRLMTMDNNGVVEYDDLIEDQVEAVEALCKAEDLIEEVAELLENQRWPA